MKLRHILQTFIGNALVIFVALTGLSGSGASSLGLGGQGGLDSLGNSGLGALSGLGGLSSLLGLGGGNLGGALGQGQGQAFGGGLSANSGGMRGGLGNSPNSLSKMGSGGGRDDSGRQIFVRNVSMGDEWYDVVFVLIFVWFLLSRIYCRCELKLAVNLNLTT